MFHNRFASIAGRVGVCGLAGYSLAAFVFTDDNLRAMGQKLPLLHAFSKPDDGLHAAHYPWDHNGWFKTFDHSA
jgi:hypothetical protein